MISLSIKAQMSDLVSIPSPTAAGLGSYGMSPVKYYSGGVDISIPLYTMENDLSIHLNYFGNGVKPDEHPGWVGSNFTLNAGGVIIRNVKDSPDEDYYYYYWKNNKTQTLKKAGYYYNHSVTDDTNWETDTYVRGLAADLDEVRKDTEPDEFNFYVGELSGSFYLSENGEWIVKSNKNVEVVFNLGFINIPKDDFFIPEGKHNNQNIKTFTGFTLIDDGGIRYDFGGSLNEIDLTIPYYGQSASAYEHYIANTWHLSKITFPNGEEINYDYEKNSPILSITRNMNFSHKIESRNSPLLYCEPRKRDYPRNICHIGSIISRPAYLKKIETPSEIIEFEISNSTELRYQNDYFGIPLSDYLDPNDNADFFKFRVRSVDPTLTQPILGENLIAKFQWKKLDLIKVKDRLNPNNEVITYRFNYTTSSNERLKLLSLSKELNNNNKEYDYKFEYYNDSNIELPNYASVQIDHWGYYNAKDGNTDLMTWDSKSKVPLSFFQNYYNERIPSTSIDVMQEGFLKKITYPTGGNSTYIYEAHDYSKKLDENKVNLIQSGQNTKVGGIRVKKVIDVASDSEQIEREFFYSSNFKSGNNISSGILTGDSKYYFHYVGQIANKNLDITNFVSHSLLPFDGTHRLNHVVYTNVIERINGNGYTINTFSNYDNGYPNELANSNSDIPNWNLSIYDPINDNSLKRGYLLEREHYNQANILVQKNVFRYKASTENYIRNIRPSSISSCENGTGYATYHSYRTYLFKFLLEEEEEEKFYSNTSGNSVIKTINYKYDEKFHLSEKSYKTSDQRLVKEVYRYPYSFMNNLIYKSMTLANITSNPIEIVKIIDGNVIDGKLNKYSCFDCDFHPANGGILINGVFKLSEINNMENGSQVSESNFLWTSSDFWTDRDFNSISPLFKPILKFKKYDEFGNIEEVENLRTGITTSYIWGYNKQYPIAKIDNANMGKIDNWLDSNWGKDITDLQYYSDIDFDNDSESHLRLWLNRLRIGAEHEGDNDVMITTYTYDPLIGKTSETNIRGRTTYYEYDYFNRLQTIKDNDKNILKQYEYNYKNQ